jgi:hypothetical protein
MHQSRLAAESEESGIFHRSILLQTEVTDSKRAALKAFSDRACQCTNKILSQGSRRSLKELWALTGAEAKESTRFNIQVV